MELMKANCKQVQLAMMRACIDPKRLQREAGISYAAVKRVMNAEPVKLSTIGKVARALGVDPAELVERE